jgi:RHS repeat-associated protein
MHGDIVATAADTTTATSVSSYFESTEYGAPRTPAATPDTYGWLGAKQRSTNDLAGLTIMGVRLYNPATGRFLSIDPVPGGNDSAYVYVTNPIDQNDLNGQWGHWRRWWRWTVQHRSSIASWAATGACFVTGPVGCAIAQTAAWAVRSQQRGWRRFRTNAADGVFSAASFGNGQAVRNVGRYYGWRTITRSWRTIGRPWHQWGYRAAVAMPAVVHSYGTRRSRSDW